jgi:hypothetical protein
MTISRIHDVASTDIEPIVLELQALLEADAILMIAMTDRGQARMQVAGEQDGPAFKMLQSMHDALLQGGMVTKHEKRHTDGEKAKA